MRRCARLRAGRCPSSLERPEADSSLRRGGVVAGDRFRAPEASGSRSGRGAGALVLGALVAPVALRRGLTGWTMLGDELLAHDQVGRVDARCGLVDLVACEIDCGQVAGPS